MTRKVTIPLAFGRTDRVDPKFAPFGALKTARNLRVRKDGRLGSRNGYQPLSTDDTSGDTMVAYDLHEFSSGRLVALGASQGEGFPVDTYEYTGQSSNPWRFSDQSGSRRPTLTPLTLPREVCGVPQPADGVGACDVAAGGGYVCSVYRPKGATLVHVQLVRESDNQVIFARPLTVENWSQVRVCFAGGFFYFFGADATSGALELGSFAPGSSSSITALATVESSGFDGGSTLAIAAVGNPVDSVVVVAYADTDASETVSVKRYDSSGNQEGSTLTLASQVRPRVAVECDETDATLNLLVSQHSDIGVITDVDLRTYDLSNTLLDGPTATNTGYRASICRLPARPGWAEAVAVVSSELSPGDLVVEWLEVDDHSSAGTVTLANACLASGVIAADAAGQESGVVFGGFVGNTFDQDQTNALWYVSLTMAHMATRDLRNSARNADNIYVPLGLSLDASTGRLAWQTLHFPGGPGTDIETTAVTTLRLMGDERRSGASVGGLLYLAGAPVQVYDGNGPTECAFNEAAVILSIASGTSGSLANGATYHYVLVWEYTLPDGTFFRSPPSLPVEFETDDAGEDQASVTCLGPHDARTVLGSPTYGAQVTGVLHRTVWDSVNSSEGSTFHEVKRFECPATLGDYGDDIVVSDIKSDTGAATQPVLYTQGGQVEDNAPEMASYLSASSSRLTVAGIPRSSEFQESKELALGEGAHFSSLTSFFGRCPRPIVGVVSQDGIRILFAEEDVFAVIGEGPNDNASGALPPPVQLGSPGGLHDWRSLLVAPDGIWFQLDPDKLYRLPRGQGSPEWLGVDVQDTLAAFPVVTGAARCRQDDAIMFACTDTDGEDARLLVRSLRTGLWTEDTPPLETDKGIEALCSFGGRVAYVSGGVVYAMSETGYTDGASSAIVTEWETYPIYPFEVGGNGTAHDLQLTGELMSAGTLALRISYDDGASFNAYDSFTLSTTGVVKRRWSLERSDLQSAVFELTFTPSSPGEGLVINQLTLLVESARGLEDLDPSELA